MLADEKSDILDGGENKSGYRSGLSHVYYSGKGLNINRKFGLTGRELQYLATPEVEQYTLDYYVNKLTGTELYVSITEQ